MKKYLILALTMFISFVLLNCSKKTESELAEEQFKLSAGASVNLEIKKLQDELNKAQTDVEKAGIHTKIAVIHDEKGDVSSLIKSAAEAVKFQPNQYMSRYLLGKSYIAAGRFNDAVDELNVSISLKGDFAPAYFEMGNAQYKKMSYPSAKDYYKKALSYDKKMIDAYNNLAVLQTLTGDLKEAEKNLKTCISIKADYAAAYKNLGILYDTKMKKNAEAVENYTKYLTLRPDCPERALVKLWLAALGG
jgi:tetratricopeptide (TPR) repeat protein